MNADADTAHRSERLRPRSRAMIVSHQLSTVVRHCSAGSDGRANPARDSRRETSPQTGRIPRVMVIDDEPDAVIMLLELLRLEGYSAHGFASGRAALFALQEVDPDVVICDVAMPGHSGWDVAREIRSIMGERRPMMIAVSGQYKKETDRLIGHIAGFNYYLTKPYTPQALLDLVAKDRRQGGR